MLIQCAECNGSVSDKALFCPHCGFPINEGTNIQEPMPKPKTRANTSRKHTKLPNGFGQIKKLAGKRRKPYAAYPPITDYTDDGKPIYNTALGYFETYNKAYEYLVFWNNGIQSPSKSQQNIMTLKELVDEWFDFYYRNNDRTTKATNISASKHLEPLYNMNIREIRMNDMQNLLDNMEGKSSPNLCKFILKHSMAYALQNDYIDKDYTLTLTSKAVETEKGQPFSEQALKILWENKEHETAIPILIMIYTGFRIEELWKAELNKKKKAYIGGNKTENGKERFVPLIPEIYELAIKFDPTIRQSPTYRNKHFYPFLESLGIAYESNKKHTPHDCRHTFSWLADKYKVDEFSKHVLMGHGLGTDVEINTYGHRTEKELIEEMNKIQIIK